MLRMVHTVQSIHTPVEVCVKIKGRGVSTPSPDSRLGPLGTHCKMQKNLIDLVPFACSGSNFPFEGMQCTPFSLIPQFPSHQTAMEGASAVYHHLGERASTPTSPSTVAFCSTTSIAVGSVIRIRQAHYLHPKLHIYASTKAVVVEVPSHPNTWFTVRTVLDSKLIKMRASAFEYCGPDLCKIHGHVGGDSGNVRAEGESVISTGQTVEVLPTDFVVQNYVDYIGLDAIVVDNSGIGDEFYTLQTSTGQIMRIDRDSCRTKSQKPDVDKIIAQQARRKSFTPVEKRPRGTGPSSEDESVYLSWVGHFVYIKKGKDRGETARAVEYSNGSFKLKLNGTNETINKKAHHLERVREINSSPQDQSHPQLHQQQQQRRKKRQRNEGMLDDDDGLSCHEGYSNEREPPVKKIKVVTDSLSSSSDSDEGKSSSNWNAYLDHPDVIDAAGVLVALLTRST
jgi:hypothetical protein